ncbi:cob(I)yrinic acid a,c-diamide adenosyltransferase [Bdellovibrionota bacterium]
MKKIYTKTGDEGTSGLFTGDRVPKHSPYLKAYGTVDELCAVLGIVHSELEDKELQEIIATIQKNLFQVGADLATPPKTEQEKQKVDRITKSNIEKIEEWIDLLDEKLSPLSKFILPGGSRVAAYLHFARTVCRRAERKVSELLEKYDANPEILIYLNRLSDFLFVLARSVNNQLGVSEIEWAD